MRLVTGLARLVGVVVFDVEWRDCRGRSRERAMTLRTEKFRIRQLWDVLCGIGRVLGERTVTGLAIDMRVLSGGLHRGDIAVAVFTSGVPGVNRPSCGNLSESVAAIMSELPEA